MNSFIWKDGRLEPFEYPHRHVVMPAMAPVVASADEPAMLLETIQEIVFTSERAGVGIRFRKDQRRHYARIGTRGRRGARRVPEAVRFDAVVFVESKAGLRAALHALDLLAREALDLPGMPGWTPVRMERRALKARARRARS